MKSALRESQDASDTMELEKAALEEAFKRTIKVKRNAKWTEDSWHLNLKFTCHLFFELLEQGCLLADVHVAEQKHQVQSLFLIKHFQLHEEEKGMLVDRVEDLTNKLYASEKSLRQLKERRLSRKAKLSAATAAAAAASGAAAAAGAAAAGPTTANANTADQ